MNTDIKFSSPDWCKLTGVIVLDPDGWDRRDPYFDMEWNEEICFDEFQVRASKSTTNGHKPWEEIKKELGIL